MINSQRTYADLRRPEPWGFCDRCNFRYFLSDLRWQWDWRGNAMQNLRILVCRPCEDMPFEQYRPIIIGPDPVPPKDPRPGYLRQEAGPAPPNQTPYEIITGVGRPPFPPNPPAPPPFVLDSSVLDGPDVLE